MSTQYDCCSDHAFLCWLKVSILEQKVFKQSHLCVGLSSDAHNNAELFCYLTLLLFVFVSV